MPRSDPTPVWVLQKTRELVARATPANIIAGIITAAGYPATERQVRRWKVKHGINDQVTVGRQRWTAGPNYAAAAGRRRAGGAGGLPVGAFEHSVVNEAVPGDERVGEKGFGRQ